MTPHELADRLQAVCPQRLRSVILYGSAAAGDFTGKRSDYNVLVVLDRIGIEELRALTTTTHAWVKEGNPPPLLFTVERLAHSADVFPIEIADMLSSRAVLFGDDVVAGIEVRHEWLRWQLESELKGKLIALRERYLLTRGKPREVTELLIQSLASLLVLFRAALRLYQTEVPANKMDALVALARHITFDASPFQTVAQLKGGAKVAGLVPDDLFARYLGTTEAVVDAIDEFLHRNDGQGGPEA